MRKKQVALLLGLVLVLLLAGLLVRRSSFEPLVLDQVQIKDIAVQRSMLPPAEHAAVDMVRTSRERIGPAGQCRELKTRLLIQVRPSQHYYNLCNPEATLWVVTITSRNGLIESSMYGGDGEHIVTHNRRIEVP